MNDTLNYQLPTFTGVLRHGRSRQLFVRDREDLPVKIDVDAQVRSGDYFVTLATLLDQFGQDLSYGKRAQIEDIVSDLIYLQDTHKVTKNKSE